MKMMDTQYSKLDDNEIITRIRENDDEAMEYMLKKYGYLVKREVRTVYLIGSEAEDLTQEGMIGLYKAVRDFQTDKGAVFSTFATLCVRRQIKNAITNSNRKKHAPLNTYVSLYVNAEDPDNAMLEERLVSDKQEDPEKLVIDREQQKYLHERIERELSRLEKQVLELYLQGLSYETIASRLGKTEKAVDNALQRIRGKLSRK